MIWTCTARPCACCRISRPECWCLRDTGHVSVCIRCAAPMVMQPPLNLNIIASVACPEDSAYLISFLGRKPECEKHDALAGQPHEPCWSMAKATFSPTEQPGDRGTDE